MRARRPSLCGDCLVSGPVAGGCCLGVREATASRGQPTRRGRFTGRLLGGSAAGGRTRRRCRSVRLLGTATAGQAVWRGRVPRVQAFASFLLRLRVRCRWLDDRLVSRRGSPWARDEEEGPDQQQLPVVSTTPLSVGGVEILVVAVSPFHGLVDRVALGIVGTGRATVLARRGSGSGAER